MRKLVTILCLSLVCMSALAQKADMRKGNRQFKKGEYAQADISYRKGLMQDTSSVAAKYNLANNLYRQENYDEAAKILGSGAQNAANENFGADYYFNQGDVAIARQDWQGAVEALTKSLIIAPDDLKAKENYIYARNKLIEQQQQQQDQNQDQDQNQNQDQNRQDQNKQDQNNQDQNQDGQQNQDQNQQNQDQQNQNQDQDKQQQEQQQQEVQLTPQQAQQLLQAIQDKEKQTQEKVDERKALLNRSRQKEKNW